MHLKHGVRADLPATAVPIVEEAARRRVLTEVLKLQDRPQTGGRVPRQYLDDWLAGSPLVEIVFDDEELREAAAAADRQRWPPRSSPEGGLVAIAIDNRPGRPWSRAPGIAVQLLRK